MEKTQAAVSLLNLTAQAGLNTLPNIGKASQSVSDISFSETLMKTTEVKPSESFGSELTLKKTVVETGAAESNKNIKTATNVDTQNKKTHGDDELKEIAKEVSKAVDEIKDKIKDEFSVSDEDIENAMEVLGLTSLDLFNTTDLRNLAMELTQTTDSIELLTNVELYDGLKEVSAFAENLISEVAEEFGISNDQLLDVINKASFDEILSEVNDELNAADLSNIEANEEKTDEVVKEVVSVDDTTENDKISDAIDNVKVLENIPLTENVKNDATVSNESGNEEAVKTSLNVSNDKAVNAKEGETNDQIKVEVKVDTVDTEKVQSNTNTGNQASNNQMNGQSNKKNLFDNSKDQAINLAQTQTVTTQTVNSVGDIVETVTSYSSYSNAENIMRQVTDYVKVNITGDVTEMEMQLHPASLGTVNMQINSQNGQITAHLTVQNELVKSVLENQMVKLLETFDEQGTKVTSIEVTVANYNLDSKSDNNYSQERDNSKSGSKKRNINLNEIDSFDDFTDEEQLEAKVMEMNGSSVNYSA